MKLQQNSQNAPKISRGTWGTLLFLFATMYFSFKHSPLDYFLEAGPAGYYQARIAYEQGEQSGKNQIMEAFADDELSMREYSDIVFPAYAKIIEGSQLPPPEEVSGKGMETLKEELRTAVSASPL